MYICIHIVDIYRYVIFMACCFFARYVADDCLTDVIIVFLIQGIEHPNLNMARKNISVVGSPCSAGAAGSATWGGRQPFESCPMLIEPRWVDLGWFFLWWLALWGRSSTINAGNYFLCFPSLSSEPKIFGALCPECLYSIRWSNCMERFCTQTVYSTKLKGSQSI